VKHISSKNNSIYKEIKKLLTSSSHRKKTGLTVAIGRKVVEDILTSELEKQVKYIAIDERKDPSPYEELDSPTIVLSQHLSKELDPVFDDQGILTVIERKYIAEEDIPDSGIFLILDGVSDPINVGALIRTASGLGFTAVLATENTADPLSPKVIRYSSGYSLFVPIYRGSSKKIWKAMKDRAIKLITTYLEGRSCTSTFTSAIKEFALCLGSEGRGLSEIWKEYPDRVNLLLKMNDIDSFNVSVAGSILMYILKTGGELCG